MTTSTMPNAKQTPSSQLPDDTLIGWLRDMLNIREFELRTMAAYQQAKIGGFCHIYIGQESVVVGTFAALEHDDPIVTAYRDHGHALARGMDPGACMAEMFGKITGCAKGKGGSMHMFDKPNSLYGGHGIVAAQTPLGTGLAFATKYANEVLGEKKKHVSLAFLGDGALNQGSLHEAMNLAGLYSLPVIYIVENNGYSMGTSIGRGTTMADKLYKKADAYGIEHRTIDGLNIMNLYDEFKPFADILREEQRPGFVDLKTYRYQGHSMSDPQKYRTKEEVAQYKDKDCIASLENHLRNERTCLSDDDIKDMQKQAKQIAKDAVKFAESSEDPTPEAELYSDVFVNPQKNLSPSGEYHEGVRNPLL